MNSIKRKPLFYDLNPRNKGKYNSTTTQLAVKRLYFVKHLRLTGPRELLSWKVAGHCRSFKRLFKFCRTFKTSFNIPTPLITPLKMSRLTRLSITYPSNINSVLLKRSGCRLPINKLSVHVSETYSPQQLYTLLGVVRRRKQAIPSLKINLPKKAVSLPTQKGIEKVSKAFGKVKGLQVLKLDTGFFVKSYMVKSLFKSMLTWNIVLLSLTIDLRAMPEENLALALSNLASLKTLKGLEMDWGEVEVDAAFESHMEEVARSFQTFLKNQTRLVYLAFKHRSMQDTCSLVDVYKAIGRLKGLETLCLAPCAAGWKEKEVDAFVASLGGHPKLKRLELYFSELPAIDMKQFYMKLNAGLNGIKKIDALKIAGAKNCGFGVENAVPLQNIFKNLLRLEFCLLIQYNARRREADVPQQRDRATDQAGEAAGFAKLIASCSHLQEVILGINQGGMINEGPVANILTGLSGLENLNLVDLSIGRIKREGQKNIFLPLVEKPEKLWCFKLKIGESYFNDEEVISLTEAMVKKKKLCSVVLGGSFQPITKEVKDFFVTSLRTHSIKTPPLI